MNLKRKTTSIRNELDGRTKFINAYGGKKETK